MSTPIYPPVPLPIRPARPVIWVCPPFRITMAPLQVRGHSLCGAGFHSGEEVIIRVTGVHGLFSWITVASPRGTFTAGLPPQICRLLPAHIRAVGNRGSLSNDLPLPALGCAAFSGPPLTSAS